MSDKRSAPKETWSENSDMKFTAEAVRDEMQQHVAGIVDLAPHRNRKAAIAWTAKMLRLPFCQVRSLFYAEARRIDAHIADHVRAYVQAAEHLMDKKAEYEAARREFVDAHPTLSRFAPGPLPDTKAEAERPASEEAA